MVNLEGLYIHGALAHEAVMKLSQRRRKKGIKVQFTSGIWEGGRKKCRSRRHDFKEEEPIYLKGL